MPVSDKTKRALRDFDLTEYEVKAYISLVESGPLPASQLSSTATIPYSKIYEILSNLERKGWVETQQGRPTQYFAKPPSAALESSKVRMENTLKSSQAEALSELEPLYEKKGVQERPDIGIVRGQNNIVDRIRETLGRTKKELLVALPVVPESIISLATPSLSLLMSKGIKVSIMVPAATNLDVIKMLKGLAEVRVRESMFGGGMISDSREAIILLGEEPEKGLTLAISSDHEGLVKFGKIYFEFLWDSSKPV